jgi:hypothetical protein
VDGAEPSDRYLYAPDVNYACKPSPRDLHLSSGSNEVVYRVDRRESPSAEKPRNSSIEGQAYACLSRITKHILVRLFARFRRQASPMQSARLGFMFHKSGTSRIKHQAHGSPAGYIRVDGYLMSSEVCFLSTHSPFLFYKNPCLVVGRVG